MEKVPLFIIEEYFKNGSLRKTASRYNVHYNTLYKWVKIYKKEKYSEQLLSFYRKPWNRTKREIEEKICRLKEEKPSITLKEIQEILKKENINISMKGIWAILKRYGYTGFKKENMSNEFIENIEWSCEAIKKYSAAYEFYKRRKIKECVSLLNSIPALPKNEIIMKIPERYLNTRRKVEKLENEYGNFSLSDYIEKIKYHEKLLKKKKMNFSFLRVLTSEIIALEWKGEYKKIVKKIEKVMKEHSNKLPFDILFTLKISLAISYTRLLEFTKAKKIARECYIRTMRRRKKSVYFLLDLATLYIYLGEYKKAENILLRIIDKTENENKPLLFEKLALINFIKGDYSKSLFFIKNSKIPKWSEISKPLIYTAFKYLIEGNFRKAYQSLSKAIEFSKTQNSYDVWICSLCLALYHFATGEKEEGKRVLKEIRPFLLKRGLLLEKQICDTILNKKETVNENHFPIIKILNLLKHKKYFSALRFSQKKGILTYFYTGILLFPESVLFLLKKGKDTYLPKSLLKFPVFSKEKIVYEIYLLRKKFKVIKRFMQDENIISEELKPKLTHKEKALLLYIAFKINEPDKKLRIQKINKNFWDISDTSSLRVSKYLHRLKKELKIPPTCLEIIHKHTDPSLINRGIYFITDYDKFEQTLIQAKSLLRAGEWEEAKRFFLSAFKIFETAPFEKMYDDWSDFTRIKMLNRFEREISSFIKECEKRKDKKLLQKAVKIAIRLLKYNPVEEYD